MLLEVRHLEVHYGGIRAVAGIDLAVGEGELVCLIGANGAGKTSTLKAICGLITSRSGVVRYAGEDVSRAPVHVLPRRGLVMVPEGRGIFPQLTVEENLAMGAYAYGGGDPSAQYERFPRLAERRKQVAGTLSGGEQQMLALARGLDEHGVLFVVLHLALPAVHRAAGREDVHAGGQLACNHRVGEPLGGAAVRQVGEDEERAHGALFYSPR